MDSSFFSQQMPYCLTTLQVYMALMQLSADMLLDLPRYILWADLFCSNIANLFLYK